MRGSGGGPWKSSLENFPRVYLKHKPAGRRLVQCTRDTTMKSKETIMNSKRMFGIALIAAGTIAAGMTAQAALAASRSTDDLWLHVKVHDSNEDSRVTINLPLSVVEKAGPMIPREARTSGRIRFD